MTDHEVVTREDWAAARDELLAREKEHTRLGDELARERREAVGSMNEAGLPPIAEHNARATGTDLAGYLTQLFGFTAFIRDDGSVYQTYSTTGRGIEFLMPYYPILDHAPKGRDEGEDWQVWIRRHDEY
jgi:predicted dithiol-disulfide oxidoreductase (DUF899 family)